MLFPALASAQGEMDALKMAQTDILGTARYMSMGGAFGALGGDASAIGVNPGGLGIYRKTEISLTPSVMINKAGRDNSKGGFNINNFSTVINFKGNGKVLKSSSFAFVYNRNTNFRRKLDLRRADAVSSATDYMAWATTQYGYTQKELDDNVLQGNLPAIADLAWKSYMIDPVYDDENSNEYRSFLGDDEHVSSRYKTEETGGINKFDFSYGLNLGDIAFLGASLGVYNINYQQKSYYSENFAAGGYFELHNKLHTTGAGIDFKVGAIVAPLNWLRIGLAVHTPTAYWLEDEASYSVNYDAGEDKMGGFDSYRSRTTYDYHTPYKVIGSLAFVIGQKGIISADYEMSDYSKIYFDQSDDYYWGASNPYDADNDAIENDFRKKHTVRVGGEYRINNNFSVRLGYSWSRMPVKDRVEGENLPIFTAGTTMAYDIPTSNAYYSGGFGYHKGFFFVDFAYALNVQKENLHMFFDPYNNADSVIGLKAKRHFAVCTFGVRF